MDKSRKLNYVQDKKLGPVDDLREELKRLEEVHLVIKLMDSEQVLNLLHDLDRVMATFEELDPAGEALAGEWARFGSVQGRLRQDAQKLLRLVGGEEALAQQRPRPAPPADHWWWYLDRIVAERNRRNLKRIGIFSFIALVIVGTAIVLFNTIFKPSPEAIARLNAVSDAYTAIELEGDFEGALAIIDEGLAAIPNDPSMLMIKGVVLQLLQRESEADDVFLLVQEILNDPVEYHLARAQVYLRTNQFEQAESDALTALELNDEMAWGWMLLGQAYEMQEKYGDALEAYQTASEIAYENEENELYVMSRLAMGRMTETLPAMSLEEGTVEPTAEPTGE